MGLPAQVAVPGGAGLLIAVTLLTLLGGSAVLLGLAAVSGEGEGDRSTAVGDDDPAA